MRYLYTIAILLVFTAGTASAGTTWTAGGLSPKNGETSSIYTPTTTTGDTQTKTLDTSRCEAITVTCFGTTLTGLLQMCDADYAAGNGLATIRCQDITNTTLTCASDPMHTAQVDPAPAFIRLASVTNSDSAQFFHVSCAGSIK